MLNQEKHNFKSVGWLVAAGGGGKGELLYKGYTVSVWDGENVQKWTVVMVAQQYECTMLLKCVFKDS